MAGPLEGLRVLEMGGIGPGPFCGMMLADHGADVIRIDRPGARIDPREVMLRSKRAITLDLKNKDDITALRELARTADALIDVFRPGVMERLGIGPEVLLQDNPRLVYGRMTGWGQTGPYAPYAGHDINYIALSGALHSVGPAERPVPPPALAGDFGGGGMMLAFSLTAAMLDAAKTGQGQVVDCAMTEGSGLLMSMLYSAREEGWWEDRRESNLVDGGAHFYGAYETRDGLFVAIGAIEPQFYLQLLAALGLTDDAAFFPQLDKDRWPELKKRVAAVFKTRTRAEWCAIMEMTDICFAPVLSMTDAPHHPHAIARESFVTVEGVVQPAPAPRYSKSATRQPETLKFVHIDELR